MTDMTLEERILSALRGDPKTIAELAEILRVNRFVLWGCHVEPMVRGGLVVKLSCGRLALPEESGTREKRA
ncbi:hypothetical protein [Marinobacter salarius]|uniref:hypothetical protein n=1 Tax=Marinobacter salarius TaxID=1420917 RepID=UPI003D12BE7D